MKNSEFLKIHCQLHHNKIEQSIDLVELCRDQVLLIKLLKGFASFYTSVEEELSKFRDELLLHEISLEERIKLRPLNLDLEYFQTSINGMQTFPMKRINNIQQIMGILYVLEGSTLGGQIIFSQLKKAKMIGDDGEGGNFWRPYGDQTSKKWQEFKKSLNSLSFHDRPILLSSAQWTFEKLHLWLVEQLKR